MDFNSRCKISGYSYTSPVRTTPAPTLRELHREAAERTFPDRRPKVHDCRDEWLVDFRDKHLWEAWFLSHGARVTAQNVSALYRSQEEKARHDEVDKMVCALGERGALGGQFEYPRGVVVTDDGDILVADTNNHRVQVFNQCGVYKRKFGGKPGGAEDGDFNEPTGVAVFINNDVIVADKRNKRIQVFSSEHKFKFAYSAVDEPIAIAADKTFNVVVGTSARTIEIYRRHGKLLSRFSLAGPKVSRTKSGIFFIAINNKDEVLVSDPIDMSVTYYTYAGSPLYRFEPQAAGEGIGFIPVGIAVDTLGQVILADSLNHVLNVYTERGVLVRHLAGPTDNVGPVQSIALGLEGHLVATEISANGRHNVKIFRYSECDCHKKRPGSGRENNYPIANVDVD